MVIDEAGFEGEALQRIALVQPDTYGVDADVVRPVAFSSNVRLGARGQPEQVAFMPQRGVDEQCQRIAFRGTGIRHHCRGRQSGSKHDSGQAGG